MVTHRIVNLLKTRQGLRIGTQNYQFAPNGQEGDSIEVDADFNSKKKPLLNRVIRLLPITHKDRFLVIDLRKKGG